MNFDQLKREAEDIKMLRTTIPKYIKQLTKDSSPQKAEKLQYVEMMLDYALKNKFFSRCEGCQRINMIKTPGATLMIHSDFYERMDAKRKLTKASELQKTSKTVTQ